jgi:hypothetical protein
VLVRLNAGSTCSYQNCEHGTEHMWLRVLMLLNVMGLAWVLWLIVVLMGALLVRIVVSLLVLRITLLTLKVWIDIS